MGGSGRLKPLGLSFWKDPGLPARNTERSQSLSGVKSVWQHQLGAQGVTTTTGSGRLVIAAKCCRNLTDVLRIAPRGCVLRELLRLGTTGPYNQK